MEVNIDGNKNYNIQFKDDHLVIDEEKIFLDHVVLPDGQSHIIYKGKSYLVTIEHFDKNQKTLQVRVGNQHHTVKLKTSLDQLLEKMGIAEESSAKVNILKAPMPGLIIDVMVKEGSKVQKDDPLLILEAMKMENVIKSPGNGQVASIKVGKGESVEKNQVLVTFS